MAVGVLRLSLDAFLILLFAYVAWQAYRIAANLYGGRFTSAGPYWVAGLTLFFLIRLIEPVYGFIVVGAVGGATFTFAMQTIQVVAGILLLRGVYEFYSIVYATSGWEVPGDE